MHVTFPVQLSTLPQTCRPVERWSVPSTESCSFGLASAPCLWHPAACEVRLPVRRHSNEPISNYSAPQRDPGSMKFDIWIIQQTILATHRPLSSHTRFHVFFTWMRRFFRESKACFCSILICSFWILNARSWKQNMNLAVQSLGGLQMDIPWSKLHLVFEQLFTCLPLRI